MFKLQNILCLIIYFYECILHAKSIPCRGTATYKLQFQAEWTNTTQNERPAGARFSGLIGCSHNKCYRMWKPGEKASLGVKNVAEKGDHVELYNEILIHIKKWNTALEWLQTKNNTIGPEAQVLLPETGNFESGFTVDSSRPLVSVIARIIPSPDWFIGVHGVNLCNESGNWLPRKRIRLFPYDAGTAATSSSNDSVIVPTPYKNIELLEGEGISDFERGIGYMRFLRKTKAESIPSTVVIDEDNCPNVASLRKVSSLAWLTLIMSINMLYY